MNDSYRADEEDKRALFAKKKNLRPDFDEKNILYKNYYNSKEKLSNNKEEESFSENIFIINEKLEKCALEILKSGQKLAEKKYPVCEEELIKNLIGEDTLPTTANKSRRDSIHSVFRNKIKINFKPNEFYEGEVDENQIMNGFGTYHYENGDFYEGEFLNGLKSGQGEYKYADGSSYIGEWFKDKKHGLGTFKFKAYEITGHWHQDDFINGFNENQNSSSHQNEEHNFFEYENESEKSFCNYDYKFCNLDKSTENIEDISYNNEMFKRSCERLNTSIIPEDEDVDCKYDIDCFITNDLYYEIDNRQSYTFRTSDNIQQILKNI